MSHLKTPKIYNKETPNGIEKPYPDFSEGKEEIPAGHVDVIKNRFLFNNGGNLEISDH